MGLTLPTAADQTTEYEDFYETTLAAPINTALETDIYPTVMPKSAAGFLVIDPEGTNPETIFYNYKDATFIRCPSSTEGEGRGVADTTARPHEAGEKIGMYSVAEFFEGVATGRFMRNGFLQARHFSSSIDPNSWIGTGETWNYAGNDGSKIYKYVTSGDKTTKYSLGTKFRLPRVTAVSTMRAKFLSSSSQYAEKISPSNFTWTGSHTYRVSVRLTALPVAGQEFRLINREEVTATGGWGLGVSAGGELFIFFRNGTSVTAISTYRAIQPDRDYDIWVSVDTAAKTAIAIVNGEKYDTYATASAATGMTQGTGNFRLGGNPLNTGYFNGTISGAAIFTTNLSQATILSYTNKELIGNEASLIALWKLNGNFNDSSSNLNHLTASGAIATDPGNMFKATEYGVLMDMSFSAGNTTMYLYTGVLHNAPSENLSSIAYSNANSPYGFPKEDGVWDFEAFFNYDNITGITAFNVWHDSTFSVTFPRGSWKIGYDLYFEPFGSTGSNAINGWMGLGPVSRAFNDVIDGELYSRTYTNTTGGQLSAGRSTYKERPRKFTQNEDYRIRVIVSTAGGSINFFVGGVNPTLIFAKNPYV